MLSQTCKRTLKIEHRPERYGREYGIKKLKGSKEMNNSKMQKIREQLRDMVLDGIETYLDEVDVSDWITSDDIENVIEDKIGDYMTNAIGEILEEVADEVFDNL